MANQHFSRHHRSQGRCQNSVIVLAVIHLALAAGLLHTAYVAWTSRARALSGLAASSQSAGMIKELDDMVAGLHANVSATLQELVALHNQTNSQLQQQVQQVKQHLEQQLRQQNKTNTASLMQHAAQVNRQVHLLHQKLTAVQQQVIGSPAPAAPAGVAVRDAELHHIAKHDSVCDKHGASGLVLNVTAELVAPLVVVGHARPGYLAKGMVTLMKYWSKDPFNAVKFPLFISIDGDDQRTLLLAAAMHEATGAQVITRRREGGPKCPSPDCHISQHYKILLQLFLSCLKAPGLIFLEEDLAISPDFFSYMSAASKLMAEDQTILCVSAWNDHGQAGRARDNKALYRTDCFPGLGWYVNSAIGLELAAKWPITNWDDWMRLAYVRNGRSCIYPEVPRTYTFGFTGVHISKKANNFQLESMILNTEDIDWTSRNLSFLLKDAYAAQMHAWATDTVQYNGTLEQLQQYCAINQTDDTVNTQDMMVKYLAGQAGYRAAAASLYPMKGDLREGIPRGSYKGVVIVRCRGRRVFLTPT